MIDTPVKVALLLFAAVVGLACHGPQEADTPPAMFVDQTVAANLDFVHFNGMSGERYFSEVVGAGAALFDADSDGDLDLYLVQGSMLGPGKTFEDALTPPSHAIPLHDRLYRNRLVEDGVLSFEDATLGSGFEGALGYGMGVAVGDYDNDGRPDLYVTNLGPNQLWHNDGPGEGEFVTFSKVDPGESGLLADARWSTSAAFVDADRDGWLDLYIVNYVDYRPELHKGCLDRGGAPEYCGPHSYPPESDRLLRNLGDGTFEDISESSGLLAEAGSGLGVVPGDFDGDGWVDLYVANDLMRNLLWINQGVDSGGAIAFENRALLSGAAVGVRGQAQASMGVDAGDVDNDGDLDLFMTHLDGDTNTLYLNEGGAQFQDVTSRLGLAEPSRFVTGFGTAMVDVDNDGWLDLVAVNGAVRSLPDQRRAGEVLPLRQPNQLFLSQRDRFTDVSTGGDLPALSVEEVSRGLATGDVDNDGDVDLVVTNNNGPARLLVNQIGNSAAWLGLELITTEGRSPQSAVIRWASGEANPVRLVGSAGSYCSARDPRGLIGLGDQSDQVVAIIDWPSGRTEEFPRLDPGVYHPLREGYGQPVGFSID